MVGRKKKTKVSSQEEDRISQLPEPLISEILCRLSTKDAVRTSALSTRWRNLWRWVPDLDLDSDTFSSLDDFTSFTERYFYPHRESWIRKLRLRFGYRQGICGLASWIDVATTRRRIEHLDVDNYWYGSLPLSIYTCKTLVHLRLCGVVLVPAEFVSLPCLKIFDSEYVGYPNKATLEKLISGSPVLEDLKLIRFPNRLDVVVQVRSRSLKRIHINDSIDVVIDAPLLQSLKTEMYSTKNFEIISSGFPAKLDMAFRSVHVRPDAIRGILTDISRVRDLAIGGSNVLKAFFLYSESRPVRQFRNLSHLNVRFYLSDLEMLPTLLESCTKLKSLVLEIVKNEFMRRHEEKRESNVRFSAVPRCLVSSLKLVELKRSITRYDGEMELVRYFLKNSTILEKLRLNVHYSQKVKCAFLTELVAMTRCSSACEVIVL